MRGRKPLRAVVIVFLLAAVAGVALNAWQATQAVPLQRQWHHQLAKDADSTLGSQTIPADGAIGADFVSHLPLLVIDTHGEEIKNYKVQDAVTRAYDEIEGVDPYVQMELSIIDNPDHVNALTDAPSTQTEGTIKIRGNYSSDDVFQKKQFRLRLLDENGNERGLPLLGMEKDGDWILNGSTIDPTYIRNYIALNTTAEFMPYVPDMRFCEVVWKNGDTYQYQGLYILYEKVQRGTGRVELSAYDPSEAQCSYLLRRDRFDAKSTMLYTWATEQDLTSGWLEVQYPRDDEITPETVAQITEEISTVERVLYSDDWGEFETYPLYLDVDSFIDYYISHEFFSCYDLNSVYLYKEKGGKLTMGPVWDYDGAMDNWNGGLFDPRTTSVKFWPWYEKLVQDPHFVSQLDHRYRELREGVLSDDAILTAISQTVEFLGNAVNRDQSFWQGKNYYVLRERLEKETGLQVAGIRDTYEKNIAHLEAAILFHGEYLDDYIYTATWDGEGESERTVQNLSGFVKGVRATLAVMFFFAFAVSIVLTQRARKN